MLDPSFEKVFEWFEDVAGMTEEEYDAYQDACCEKYGIGHALRPDAPPDVVEKFKELCEIERKQSRTGIRII